MAGFLERIARIFRHRWWDEADVRRKLPDGALHRLEARVTASERQHGGEIRVCVEAGLPLSYLWRGLTAHHRAIMMFSKLRVWDTERNNGVLIYLLMAEHTIEIVADRGLNACVDAAQWARVIDTMRQAFVRNQFEAGLNDAMDAVDALLQQHFPLRPGEIDANELPNAPFVI